MSMKVVKKCCGYCNAHRKVICGLFTKWECTEKRSDRYGLECEFHDTCEYWNQDGPYLAQPIMKDL